MKRRWLNVAIVACVFGAVCAALSLHNYFRIFKNGMIAEGSFCAVSEYVNCDVVEASSYASIKGIPIASFGLIWYILIFFFSVYARFSRGFKKPTVAFAWWTSGLSVLYSIYLSYISVFELRALCLTCIGMYAANIVLFVSLYLAMNMPFKEGINFLWGYWWTSLSRKKMGIDFKPKFMSHLILSIVAFGIGLVFVSSASGNIERLSKLEINEYVDRFYRQSKYDIKFDQDNSHQWGTKGAPVTIVEFSDYRCPFCKISAFLIKPFLAEYKNDVAYYFINYPLDSTCNHYMQHQMHPGACLGARGGICADDQGKYWEYHDAMFRSTGQINMTLMKDVAKKLGLNIDQFVKCINSAKTERRLQNEIEAARRIYITGTPSIFVNNRHLKFWRNPDVIREVVSREIKAAKKGK